MARSIIFVDANTVWHRRLAQALAESGPLIAISPCNGLVPKANRHCDGALEQVTLDLPRGWASLTSSIGQRLLLRHIRREARALGDDPLVVLTSPAYAPLARMLKQELPIVSYTADDYRHYAGWGGPAVIAKEGAIHKTAALSVFVSESLRERAVTEHHLDPARTWVSPNATEHRFAHPEPDILLPELAGRKGPVVGIIGALSDRLDCDVLAGVAGSDSVGTFLIAGPASEMVLDAHSAFRSAKCVITGYIDHSRMHLYAQALDLALIPYSQDPFNYHCSPMRLYDHLATGARILALSGCDQIDRARYPGLHLAGRDEFVTKAEEIIALGLEGPARHPSPEYFWDFRSSALRDVLERVAVE